MTRIRRSLAAAAVVCALALSGCAAPHVAQPSYDPAIVDQFRSQVLDVSTLASSADYPGALVSLSELEAQLKDALARGLITNERYESILAAAALVRSDLQSAIDSQVAPPPPESSVVTNGDDGKGKDNEKDKGKGKGNKDD